MKKEELTLEEQVARIRNRREKRRDFTKLRAVLNTIFLAIAAVGLLLYFTDAVSNPTALGIIAIGMVLKIVEFILRYTIFRSITE